MCLRFGLQYPSCIHAWVFVFVNEATVDTDKLADEDEEEDDEEEEEEEEEEEQEKKPAKAPASSFCWRKLIC